MQAGPNSGVEPVTEPALGVRALRAAGQTGTVRRRRAGRFAGHRPEVENRWLRCRNVFEDASSRRCIFLNAIRSSLRPQRRSQHFIYFLYIYYKQCTFHAISHVSYYTKPREVLEVPKVLIQTRYNSCGLNRRRVAEPL